MLVRFVVSRFGLELIAYESPDIPLNVDPDLLSGMLQAMESIGVELKNPIQEIKFSNWVIYIRPYPDFTIRLILADHIPKEKADEYFGQLYIKVKDNYPEIEKGRTLTPEKIRTDFLPTLKPLMIDPSAIPDQAAEIPGAAAAQQKDDTSKIVMAGLGAVGKTSIKKLFLDHVSPTVAGATKPTLGVDVSKRELDYLEGHMAVHEFGGQVFLRAKYLANRSLWLGTTALIFVVDVQKPEQFIESRDYLRAVWKIIKETHPKLPTLSIFLHKYDPTKRKEMSGILKLCIETFGEFRDVGTFHLTAIEDKSSNVAIVKTIFLSLPTVIMQNMLNEDFFNDMNQNLFPKFTPLVLDDASPIDDDLRMEIRSSSVLYGRGYGNKLQKLWIKYLAGESAAKGAKQNETSPVQVKKIGKYLHVSIKKDPQHPNLATIVLDGVLTGITKSFQFLPPKIVAESNDAITWQIGL